MPKCYAISPNNTRCTNLADHPEDHKDINGFEWEGPEPDHFDTSLSDEYCPFPKNAPVWVKRCACGEEIYGKTKEIAQEKLDWHIDNADVN